MPKTPARFNIPELLLKLAFTRQLKEKDCSHLHLIQVRQPSTNVCQDCVDLGDSWPNLRMCLICGYVGCCDTSKNKHMHAHLQETDHPLIRSIESGEGWMWCYPDEAFLSARSSQLDESMPITSG
jgi:uncharacterized UBP type Zn finger protein